MKDFETQCKDLHIQLADAENKLLEAYLVIDFYAHEESWEHIQEVDKKGKKIGPESPSPIEHDGGKVAREYLEEGIAVDELPCDVFLPPATIIHQGCSFRTLLYAIGVRESWTKLGMWNEDRWQIDRKKALMLLDKANKHRGKMED